MNWRALIALAVVSLFPAPQCFADDKADSPEWVSLVNLIAAPEKYHNKKVFISAFVIIEFENMSLCLTEHSLSSKDCLWLEIDSRQITSDEDAKRYKTTEAIWRRANRQVASIHGTFDKDDTGHLGGWSGGIKDVTRVYAKDVYIDFTSDPPVVKKRHPRGKSQ